ncbi:hypothetical protein H8356DRAFT_1369783 [Neocallimastix lanati (nom. inval.)]|nr:hypothetical protein H8356DRAFT_1369783 [Neocallimastix sp. JGI-2020a]
MSLSNNNNPFDEDRRDNFYKLFIANVGNRLRELESPSDIDCTRWIWELLQNAKDSISHEKNRTGVDIKIIVNDDSYTFKHNGAPFTFSTLTALLYKYSEGKNNDSESTGRFGTGFLTTHTLSKTVKITGDIFPRNQDKPVGFEITMYREGKEDKELLDGLGKTEKSYNAPVKSDGWTSFEYLVKTDRNKEAGQLGIQSLKNNITEVMLFCPTINSIELNENGKIFTVNRSEIVKNDPNELCEKLILNINDNGNYFSKSFIYTIIDEPNDKLSEKFEANRNLRICCAIELDNNNNIFIDKSTPCLFCSLPLVGSEKHELPFIINSPDFEPETERQAILLEGDEIDEKTGKISNPGINKMILLRSQEMFENLLINVCQNEDIKNRYLLTRGLNKLPNEIRFFDYKWYEKKFIRPMRDILINYPIVWNGKQHIKITNANVNLPMIKKYEEISIQKEAYNLISQIYENKVPTFEESINFENHIWPNDERINYITMERCIKYLESFKNITNLENKIGNSWKYINSFILFIKNHHNEFIKNYNIIPNMKSEFIKLNNNVSTSKEVPENMIECLEELGNQWKSYHIHKNINVDNICDDHDINIAISTIQSYFNKWSDKILILISYIPNDYENKKLIEKRETIYELCSLIWNDSMPTKRNGNSFPERIWNGIDEILFENLIEHIERIGNLTETFNIKYMKKFLKLISEYYPSYKDHSIIPNQNGKFCKIGELYEDENIPEIFKECMLKYFNKDIKEELIDNELISIKSLINNGKKRIYDYNNNYLNKYFCENSISDDNKIKVSKYLIRIIPKESNEKKINFQDDQDDQRKLLNIYQKFVKDNNEIVEIDRNDYNKELWKYSNKYIYFEIKQIINKHNIVDSLSKYLNIEKSQLFEYLKFIILKGNLKGKIIPNQYEIFCDSNNIFNDGILNPKSNQIEIIPDKYKDISKELEYDIRKHLIHPKIGRLPNIPNFSTKDLKNKIDEIMEENFKNKTNYTNSKYRNATSNLIEDYITNMKQNNLNNEEKFKFFENVYIEKSRNKLKDMESPSDEQFKSWIWELIQNAKDSILNDTDKENVDIEITTENDRYTFKHNGSPFTNQTFMALLYEFNESKNNNLESTCHFTTSFLTTHCLSKIVKIKGDLISERKNFKEGFEITMNREGESDKELLEGIRNTENSYHSTFESNDWTEFEYITKTERNKKAGKLGIQNFKENIYRVMLFNPEINSIKLDENGKLFTVCRNNVIIKNGGKDLCNKLILNINDNGNYFSKTFIYNKIDEPNVNLSEKYEIYSNLRICCAIELDNYNNIFTDNSSPCLFCSFPLVGSEKNELPFIINSPDFECETERKCILFDGDEIDDKTGNISKTGINKMILLRSQKIFENLLVNICQNEDIKNRYLLTRGLNKLPKGIKFFDYKWYEEKFIRLMRDILINYPIVWNGKQHVKITNANVNLPMIKKYEEKNIQKEAYYLISQIYENKVPTFEESINFENHIWPNDERINYITMERCIKYLESFKNITNLENKIGNSWKYINSFILFIKNHHNEFIKNYNIIPNMKSEFIKLKDNIATSKEVPENMIECLEELGNPWKSYHIHKNININNIFIDDNINMAISAIQSYLIESPDKILILISYIPNDYENKKLIEKRETIYELCSLIWNDSMPTKRNGNSFPERLWNGIDEIIFKILIEHIERIGNLTETFNIKFMKKFLKLISEYYPLYKDHSIIPNQNGKFCKIGELYEDENIPEIFKECMLKYFNKDIKEELIDNELISIKSLINNGKKRIYDYNGYLSKLFISKLVKTNDKIEASEYLIRIIPKESHEEEKDFQDDQRKLLNIYQKFVKDNNEIVEIERNDNNKELWKYSNKYIYFKIEQIIEKYKNINSLSKYLNIEKSQLFEYLKFIILKGNLKGIIIPNQYEIFCDSNNIFNDGILNPLSNQIETIPQHYKDISKKLDYDIQKYLIHPKIGRLPDIDSFTTKDLKNKIDEIMDKNYENNNNKSDSKLKFLTDTLMKDYFKNVKQNIFDDNKMKIFGKLYIANVRNRLRELENPSIEDCKRWIWELIQNAKDSIAGCSDRKSIDIEINIKDDIYTFKHNGAPFTDETLTALLYKLSEGKSDNSESTGRFGTGFLTTHCLSKIVKIKGDIVSEDKNMKGFDVIMYREGEDDKELSEELNKTEKSYKSYDKLNVWTSFEYLVKTEKNRRAGQLGIQNFKENIYKVMLFNPKINSIKLDENGKIFAISRNNIIVKDDPNELCEKLILNINRDNNYFSKSFIYNKIDEPNDKLSERFKTNRNLRICCAIELDNNNIYIDNSSPCLFCSLPLVGSEKHELPFIINSPDFECETERQAILLEGDDFNEKTGKFSNPGINKMILLRSQKMFENLLINVCQNEDIKNRYLLTRGLNTLPKGIRFFNYKWYEKKFIRPMRDILINYPIVWNGKQHIKITNANVNLPMIKKYEEKNIQKEAYYLISQIYENKVPTFEESINFENHIWPNDERINYITMERCIKYLESFKNITNLENKIGNSWEYINSFILFIKNHHIKYLKNYNIIPNMKSEFIKLKDNIATSKEVPENMIECLEELGNPWKSYHIHKNININNIFIDDNINMAISAIQSYLIESPDKILILISYIPNDYENKKLIEKRETIYELCSLIWNDSMPTKRNGNSFPERLWNGIDEIIFKILIEHIERIGNLTETFNIKFMKKFLKLISEYYPLYKDHSIIPNQNGKFCKIGELYEDENIPEIFKELVKTNNKVEASECLIRIIPKESHEEEKDFQDDQRKLLNIYQKFVKDNNEIVEIDRNDNNKELWKYPNKYIYFKIEQIIEKHNNVDSLSKYLNIEKSQLFEYLKFIILKGNLKGKIIPNQYEIFCDSNNIFNDGILNPKSNQIEIIPENYKDISKELDYDIREYLIHPKIGRLLNIPNFSTKDLKNKIDEIMDEKIQNNTIYTNSKYRNATSNLIDDYISNMSNSLFDSDEKIKIFDKVYIANVRNRLRELENPSTEDCKRWIWELVQNAKDSIANDKDKENVDIEITVKDDLYEFKHNGSPFTNQTFMALLYKFSEGKSNSIESTGRFGTGFLTTHCLSKTVKISGEITKNNSTPQGFEITMFREGEDDDELLEGLRKTEKEHRYPIKSDGWTKFEYIAKTERNKGAGRLGIQNFRKNICKVMMFCPEINSIKLNDNGNIYIVTHKEIQNSNNIYKKLILKINDNNYNYYKTFLCYKIEEHNEKLSERFKTNRNLRICCAIELDNNNIYIDYSSPCLFCSLPLVGSEKHELPFIINSPDFEPDSERKCILLDGDEINEQTGKISNPGINKMILLRSQEMFKNLLINVCQNEDIKNRYLLTRGLNKLPKGIKFFDYKWYEEKFILPMRDILINYPIVWNGKQHVKITNVNLPIIGKYEEKSIQKEAYDLISQIYENQVPTFEESINFENHIWPNDERINYITMERCIKYLESFKNITNLENKIGNSWKYINSFILFIKNHHNEFIKNYNIIPNMNSEFIKLDNNIATSKEVPENMIECLEELGFPWKLYHIHKNINVDNICDDHDIWFVNYIFSKYSYKWSETWSDKILILISYIPNDYEDKKLIEKRETIYELCSLIWNDKVPTKRNGNSFPESLWKGIDEIIFKNLIMIIKRFRNLNETFNIKFMKKFLKLVSEYYPLYVKYSIIPNQNGKFRKIEELYEDENIPEIFKECLHKYFNKDIKKELIDNELIAINLLNNRKKRIFDYNNYLNESYMNESIPDDNKIKASKYLIRIIPKEANTVENVFNILLRNNEKEFDYNNDQRKLSTIYKIFIDEEIEFCEIERDKRNKGLWELANKYIYNEIKSIIEHYNNVDLLSSYLNIEKKKVYEYLKVIIKFSSEGKIIPNQYEEFCDIVDLYCEKENERIPVILKNIIKNLGYDIKKHLIHQNIENHIKIKKFIFYKDVCKDIDEWVKKYYNDPNYKSSLNFKDAVTNLIETYFEEIGEEKSNEYFPYTFSIKEKIKFEVIYDKDKLIAITNLEKMIDIKQLTNKLQNEKMNQILQIFLNLSDDKLQNEKLIQIFQMFLNLSDDKLQNKKLIQMFQMILNLSDDNIDNIKKFLESPNKINNNLNTLETTSTSDISLVFNPTLDDNEGNFFNSSFINSEACTEIKHFKTNSGKNISLAFNSTLDALDDGERDFYSRTINDMFDYYDDFDYSNPINKRTGNCGEAYIYELLLNSGKFKSVEWRMLSKNGIGQKLDYRGKTYTISEDGSHYDIVVVTMDDRTIYIEVKSTKHEFNSTKVPFYLSKMQINMMESIIYPNEYVLAVVFDVMNNPKHFFMNLRKDVD